MERDLKALSPKDRLLMLEKLMQYVVSKQKTEMEIRQVTVEDEKKVDNEFDLSCVSTDLLVEMANYILDGRRKELQRQE